MVSASGLCPPAPVEAECRINCSICKAPSGRSIRDPFSALLGAPASVVGAISRLRERSCRRFDLKPPEREIRARRNARAWPDEKMVYTRECGERCPLVLMTERCNLILDL